MPPKLYKVGEKSSTGQEIACILGQSPLAFVYTTIDNQLRWHYYGNGGVPTDEQGITIAKFDTLMDEIRDLKGPLKNKLPLYTLLGKSLFIALNASKPNTLPDVFARVEKQITVHQRAGSNSRTTSSKSELLGGSADLAIVCALHEPELEAILSIAKWTPGPRLTGDPQTYYSSTWRTRAKKKLKVIAAAPNQMGLTASGILAAKIILQFKPKLLAMAGIAAGSKSGKQGFGDILFPDQTFDYGSGKTIIVSGKRKVLPSPDPIQINPKLLGRLKEWQLKRTGLDEVSKGWPATKPKTRLDVHIGPMFSSATVLGASRPIEELMSQWRKLIGVEMEAHSVHRACSDTIEPSTVFFCAKSICDFAEGKNDDWQHYAAFTSARFLHKFIVAEWSTLFG